MRLDLGPLDKLASEKPFEVEGSFDPMQVGGETVEFDGPVSVRGKVERVRSGARLRGQVTAPVRLRCGRCLDRYQTVLSPEVEILLHGADPDLAEDDSIPYAPQVDLAPAVEEAIVLELPVRPLCRPDCQGLCPRCGARREDGCACEDEPDPRWNALGDWVRAHGEGDERPER